MIPGEYILCKEKIVCNEGSEAIIIEVINKGDRAVQVGSHFHFYEVNDALEFDREKARGRRLDIASGTSIRFEPGDKKKVPLIEYTGNRQIFGFRNKVDGFLGY